MAAKKVVEAEVETGAAAAKEVKAAAPKKTTRRTTAAKKDAAVKKETAPEKEAKTASEAAPKKTTRRTAAKKAAALEAAVFVEYAGKQVVAKEVLAAAIESFKAANADTEIRTVEVYMKPEENVAYYVVNGVGSEDFKVEL